MSQMTRSTLSAKLGALVSVVFVVAASVALMVPDHAEATFPGRNGRIAFMSGNHIYTMSPRGDNLRSVIRARRPMRDLSWSPDGRWLAFSCGGTRTNDAEICLVRSDGSQRQVLTDNEVWDDQPAWSPDGSRLVFTRSGLTNTLVMILDIANGSEREIANLPLGAHDPEWSPTGDSIALVAAVGTRGDIHVMDPDGSNITNITNTPNVPELGISWAPSGERIVFSRFLTSDDTGATSGRGWYLFTVDADGTNDTQVGHLQGTDPVWSPAGGDLLFTRLVQKGSAFALFRSRLDGRGVQRLRLDAGTADWKPR